MQLTTFFVLASLAAVALLPVHAVPAGGDPAAQPALILTCENNEDCKDTSASCIAKTCVCNPFTHRGEDHKCKEHTCANDPDCKDANAFCNPKSGPGQNKKLCDCKTGFDFDAVGVCKAPEPILACEKKEDCKDALATCTSKTCVCNLYTHRDASNKCKSHPCDTDKSCNDANAYCNTKSGDTKNPKLCDCKKGFDFDAVGVCKAHACSEDKDCNSDDTNAVCDKGAKVCACKQNFAFDANHKCAAATCAKNDDCHDKNAWCDTKRKDNKNACVCNDHFKLGPEGAFCVSGAKSAVVASTLMIVAWVVSALFA